MAINSSKVEVRQPDAGLILNSNAANLPPGGLTETNNVHIRDGKIHTRNAFISSTNFSGSEESNIRRYLGFFHNRDYHNAAGNEFHAFYHVTNDQTIKTQKIVEDATAWSGTAAFSSSLASNLDYWMNFTTVIEDTNNDGVIDDRYLLACPSVTHPGVFAATNNHVRKYENGNWTEVTGSLECKRVLTFFGKTVYLGIDNALKVRWSNQFDHANITVGNGSAGHTFLTETEGAIMNAALLKSSIVCYKEDSVYIGTNLTSSPFLTFEPLFPDLGLLGTQLLAVLGDKHYFVGTNNIYMYTGGGNPMPIGDQIWTAFKDDLNDGGVNATQLYKHRAFTSIHRDSRHVLFWIPTGSEVWPNKAYVLDTQSGGWTTWTPPVSGDNKMYFTGWGEFAHDDDINDAEYIPVYGGAEDPSDGTESNKSIIYDYTTYSDCGHDDLNNDQAILSSFATQEVSTQLREGNGWSSFTVEMKGKGATDDVVVTSFDTEAGTNFITADTLSVTNARADVYTSQIDRSSYGIRFKVSCATAGDGFEVSRYEIDPESENQQQSYPYRGSGRSTLL